MKKLKVGNILILRLSHNSRDKINAKFSKPYLTIPKTLNQNREINFRECSFESKSKISSQEVSYYI